MLNYDNKRMYIPDIPLRAAGVAGKLGTAMPVLGLTRGARAWRGWVMRLFWSLAKVFESLKRLISKS